MTVRELKQELFCRGDVSLFDEHVQFVHADRQSLNLGRGAAMD